MTVEDQDQRARREQGHSRSRNKYKRCACVACAATHVGLVLGTSRDHEQPPERVSWNRERERRYGVAQNRGPCLICTH